MKRILSICLLMVIAAFNLFAVDIVPLPYKVKTTNKKFSLETDVDYEKLLMERNVSIKSFQMIFSEVGLFRGGIG